MALSATRFKLLDQETNVATTDFTAIKSADVLNAPGIAGVNITSALTSMLSGSIGDKLKSAISAATGKVGALSNVLKASGLANLSSSTIGRLAKDGLSNGFSASSFSTGALTKSLSGVVSSASSLSSLTKGLSTSQIGTMVSGALSVPTSITKVNINGIVSSTGLSLDSATSVSKLVDKASGGNFGAVVSNTGVTESILSGVGGLAIKSGLSGAFTALAKNTTDQSALKNAGMRLLKTASESKNLKAITEIATSSVGKAMKAMLPSVSSTITSGVSLPTGTSEPEYIKRYGEVKEALDFTDASWCKADSGGNSSTESYSVANISATNPDFGKLLEVKSKSYTPVISYDGSIAPVTSDAMVYAGVSTTTAITNAGGSVDPLTTLRTQYPEFIIQDSGSGAVAPSATLGTAS